MSGYVTVNRLSLVQLYSEERKQRAHLKKIAEMQRRSGLDNNNPIYFPHLNNSYTNQMKKKYRELTKENNAEMKKLLDIMQPKSNNPLKTPFHSASPNRRHQKLSLAQRNIDYAERIEKIRGMYDVRQWEKGFQEHKEHLKISKNNKLFTPRDVGINRRRIKVLSGTNSKPTAMSPTTSEVHRIFNDYI